MKLIKNALVYKADLPSSTALEAHLKEKPFIDPLPLWAGSSGFVSRNGEGLVDTFIGGLAFTVRIDTKIVPASAVKAELDKRSKQQCEETGRTRLSKAERADLKDMITAEFRAKALVKTALVTCFYRRDKQYLIIPTSSRTTAAAITSLLIAAVGSVKTETIHVSDVKHGLTTRMQAWLGDDPDAFGEFMPHVDTELAMGSQKLTVKMEQLTEAKAGLHKAFADGFGVKSMRLLAGNEVSFKLTSDFAFKSIDFPANPDAEKHDDDVWLHEAAVQTLNLSSVITELCDMLGYKEPEQEKEAV
jgi:recombination associated protein RdgC